MPTYKVLGPDNYEYKFDGPEDATEDEKIEFAGELYDQRQQKEKDLAAHINKGGGLGAFKQAGWSALGGAEDYLGKTFGSDSLQQLGARHKANAAAVPYEPTTGSDVLNVRGISPTIHAGMNVVNQTLGGMAARFGAPVAGMVAGAALAPEVALGGAGVTAATGLSRFIPAAKTLWGGAAGTAVDMPIAGGENIEERGVANKQREKEGLPPLPTTDAVLHLSALGQAALLGFMPGARTVNKYIGPQMLRDAEMLAPKVAAGTITEDAAVKLLASKGADYARAAAANATNVAGLGIGTAAMRRGQAGESVVDEAARKEYLENIEMAATLAPFAAIPHTYGARGKAEGKLAEAGKARETQVADEAWLAQQQAEQQAQTTNQTWLQQQQETARRAEVDKSNAEQQARQAWENDPQTHILTNDTLNEWGLTGKKRRDAILEAGDLTPKEIRDPTTGEITGYDRTNIEKVREVLEDWKNEGTASKKKVAAITAAEAHLAEIEALQAKQRGEGQQTNIPGVKRAPILASAEAAKPLSPLAEEAAAIRAEKQLRAEQEKAGQGTLFNRQDNPTEQAKAKPISPEAQAELAKILEIERSGKATPDQMYSLAYMYEHGIGVDINHAKAMELLSKAAEQGHGDAQYMLGEQKQGELFGEPPKAEAPIEPTAETPIQGKGPVQENLFAPSEFAAIANAAKIKAKSQAENAAKIKWVNAMLANPKTPEHIKVTLRQERLSAQRENKNLPKEAESEVVHGEESSAENNAPSNGAEGVNPIGARDNTGLPADIGGRAAPVEGAQEAVAGRLGGTNMPAGRSDVGVGAGTPGEQRPLTTTTPIKPLPPGASAADQAMHASQIAYTKPAVTAPVAKPKGKAAQAMEQADTMIFSSNAALLGKVRRAAEAAGIPWNKLEKIIHSLSNAQSLHADQVASVILQHGDAAWDAEKLVFTAVEDVAAQWKPALETAAAAHNMSLGEMQRYAHRAFEARRLEGLVRTKNPGVIHMTPAQIAEGVKLFKIFPELEVVANKWNQSRENTMKLAVEHGELYTREGADELLRVLDWVPFQRVAQVEGGGKGFKQYINGLVDATRDKAFKGSHAEVNNVFENMENWQKYILKKSMVSAKARAFNNAILEFLPHEIRKVGDVRRGMEGNTITIWEKGEAVKYELDDPLVVVAFKGVESISIPILGELAMRSADILRESVVLNPGFSLSQLPQDMFTAMFASGVKQPFALPLHVAYEFSATLAGHLPLVGKFVPKTKAFTELYKVGAVGEKHFRRELDADSLKAALSFKNRPFVDKLLAPLQNLAMVTDNSIRQAVYKQILQETKSTAHPHGNKAQATEVAFEIINFRRHGASETVDKLKQVNPFFGSYLQSMNVVGKTLFGKGLGAQKRTDVVRNLTSTGIKTMALGFIYNMMMSEDPEYKKLAPNVRDRHIVVPGTDGFMIPLRPDMFTLLFKVIPENVYHMTTGGEDGTAGRKAIRDAVANAVIGPNVTPQVVRGGLEVLTNYDFRTGKQIVGHGESSKVGANTSELAKVLGGDLVPAKYIDHLGNSYLGFNWGLASIATNALIAESRGIPRPTQSTRDMLASTPGLTSFISKEFGAKDLNDFYELAGQLQKVAGHEAEILKSGGTRAELDAYRAENIDILSTKKAIEHTHKRLNDITTKENRVRNAPASEMSADEKQRRIHAFEVEKQAILKDNDRIGDLRKRAGF